jgi:putative transposase
VRVGVEKFGASERFACALLGQNRSAFRKKKPDMGFEEAQLRAALLAVAGQHPAWGWRKARWHLLAQPDRDGVALNRKRIRRLWRDEGLTCKPRARKKRRTGPGAGEQKRRTGPGAGEQKRLTAQYPMHVVSFDFQSDVTSCGQHIRFFFRHRRIHARGAGHLPAAVVPGLGRRRGAGEHHRRNRHRTGLHQV